MSTDLEVIESTHAVDLNDDSLAATITRVEIDTLISTARAYPRSISQAQKRMLDLVTLDEESADDAVYSLPRGGRALEGPSIRFAEAAAQCWGNCRVAARTTVVDKREKYVEAEGFFLDAETNVATLARIRRRISDKRGNCFADDMILVTSNAAQSIARRNAILAGIPKAVWKKPYEAARKVIMGDIKTLANRRADAIKAMQRFGLTEAQVLHLMNVKGIEDIDQEKLVPLRGMFSSLTNGDVTVEELMRTVEPERKERVTASTATNGAPAIMSADVPTADAKPAANPTEPDKKPDTASARTGTTEPQTAEKTADVPAREPAKEPAKEAATAQADMLVEFDDRDIIAGDLIEAIRAAATGAEAERIYLDAEDSLAALGDERRAKVEASYQRAAAKFKPKKKAGAA